ncbi:GTP-binding protein SAR1 [Purpureocillium lavendulum]|uniref:GTP-binding protein SAR1 n=1 Tax=Purpureocillium lavendulum TaxID=1247861 RepID=A0AB34G5J8_9HYPO|nr:GTP-binding protein SAR1 [Purpureocillium lavendulum]
MSTPTTAVATLPRYHSHHTHYHPYPHQPLAANPPAVNSPNYRSAVAAVTSSSLLPPPAPSTPSSSCLVTLYPPVTAGSGAADGVATSQASAPRPPPHDHLRGQPGHRHQHHHTDALDDQNPPPVPRHGEPYTPSTMAGDQPSRKRRRSREPDWNSFYRNGLPSEIIVIDDTPEPEPNTGRKITNGTATVVPAPAAAAAVRDPLPAQPQPAAKKRRKDDRPDASRASGYHVQYVGSHASTPLQNTTPIGSTISSDRTNSALHTTAPTSLSSNSQYDDGHQAPLKRKRNTRQAANEAKRRDVDGLGDPFFTYKPPAYPPKKASEVHVRVVHDRHHDKNHKVDDDDGHYIVVPDAELTEKYQITRLLGQGTFGKVVQARERKRNKSVAVKIIRSVQKYRDASRIELRVLATLKANDEDNRNRCIHLRDCFDYRGHICIVMDLLGQSVFDFLKGNGFVPFPNSQIQSFARQLFTSVAFLHDLNLIHTDLKPENILLCDAGYQTFTYNRKIPSSSTTINRQATQRRVLLDTEIRLIDFGSATFQDEYHSSVVSTRHYRAPEIILGLGWSYPCDIWSIGCILVEFFTGDALFQTHDNLEHLAMMEAVVGRRIDSHLVQAVNKMSTRSGGNPASKYASKSSSRIGADTDMLSRYFKRLKLDYPTPDTTRGSRRFVKAMKQLHDIIPSNTPFLKNFLDLLGKIFVYDPAHRITAKEALNHAWFKEMAHPDDGTEAAKIRLERKRAAEHEHLRRAQFV